MTSEKSTHSADSREYQRASRITKSSCSPASITVTLPHGGRQTLPPSGHNDPDNPVQIRTLSASRSSHHNAVDPQEGETRSYSPYSSGTVPPQATPIRAALSDREREKIIAARAIENAWLSYRDKQMFRLLKHAICAAEHSLSYEILRKVSPQEANLLKDKSMQMKVRFRFAGQDFPPMIYFKIYSSSSGGFRVKYVSGKKMIQPASEAAQDACSLMGHRRFYDQLMQDLLQYEAGKMTDEGDVTTMKDYMQYLSHLDETPSYMGGRDNSWRKLTLEVLPRHTVFYHVVDYLQTRRIPSQLEADLPLLLVPPTTEDIQLKQIKLISQLRSPSQGDLQHVTPRVKSARQDNTSRRSRQARDRARQMRKTYETGLTESKQTDTQREIYPDDANAHQQVALAATGVADAGRGAAWPGGREGRAEGVDPADWDEEADKLYEWTRDLSYDDLAFTPRPGLLSQMASSLT